jgi:hypothetical protein
MIANCCGSASRLMTPKPICFASSREFPSPSSQSAGNRITLFDGSEECVQVDMDHLAQGRQFFHRTDLSDFWTMLIERYCTKFKCVIAVFLTLNISRPMLKCRSSDCSRDKSIRRSLLLANVETRPRGSEFYCRTDCKGSPMTTRPRRIRCDGNTSAAANIAAKQTTRWRSRRSIAFNI